MGRAYEAEKKKRAFLKGRAVLALVFCAVLLLAAFVFCFFLESAKAKKEHDGLIGTRIAVTEPETELPSSPVPAAEILSPDAETTAPEQAETTEPGTEAETP